MTDYGRIDAYVLQLIERSTPERTAWNLEKIREGKPVTWNYIDGCMLKALTELTEITGDPRYADFAAAVMDHFVQEDGESLTLQPEKRQLDDINEGKVLFPAYKRTGREKYRLAADRLHALLAEQPRTKEGSWWHKQIYPDQVWLDGIYMAQPFEAQYRKEFGDGDYTDILRQVRTVREKMRDPATGLYYHGYDASRKAFWADPETGLSRSFWLRAIGWFSVALADLCELLPEDGGRQEIAGILRELMESIVRYADPATGLYWQVADQAGREGNYLESSGSSMIAFAMLKGARLGVLEERFQTQGRKTFDGLLGRLEWKDGTPELGGICLVAGLGPENNRRRDGSYGYYISEPVVANDAKGVAPFILCYTEILRG
jgi:unsaturated rhamnogalacturonyl hydrolase